MLYNLDLVEDGVDQSRVERVTFFGTLEEVFKFFGRSLNVGKN